MLFVYLLIMHEITLVGRKKAYISCGIISYVSTLTHNAGCFRISSTQNANEMLKVPAKDDNLVIVHFSSRNMIHNQILKVLQTLTTALN